MVALVEVYFREVWLEVRYGEREVRDVSLGAEPVTLGSAPGCTVYVGKAPALALRYRLDAGRILCRKGEGGAEIAVSPGHQETVGPAQVVVRALAGAQPAAVAPPTVGAEEVPALSLWVSAGACFPLIRGARLYARDLPSLVPGAEDGVVAEVVPNPTNPAILGLKNCTRHTWSATMPGGMARRVEPGRSLQLQAGSAVNFGPVRGEIR
jgi:hypothetical protein